MSIHVLVSPSPHVKPLLQKQIQAAVDRIAQDFGWSSGQISIAILDDERIQEINRQYLQHDYPTDVISFDLTESDEILEGEILVSWETAARVAQEQPWPPQLEMLLYVIHGMLHIIGLDDDTPAHTRRMRQHERHYMQAIAGDTTPCNPAKPTKPPSKGHS
ncbi:MAG: rRNA maturation RNase YbeY [Planctomycetota bacterium]|jgi:probable rRNA maturation factor